MDIDTVLQKCRELRKLDSHADAIVVLNNALREVPDARLFHARGITFEQMDQPTKAVEDITSAIRFDKTNAKYVFDRGCILAFPLDRNEDAIRDFEEVLKLQPDHVEAHRQLCGSLLIMGRPNRALEHAEIALRLAPNDARTHFWLGETYLSLKRFNDALMSLKRAVELDATQDQYSSALNRALRHSHEQAF
jgi:tetratricopeptide (TPR) repeat protein